MDADQTTPRPRRFTDEEKAEMIRLYTTRLPDGTWMGATSIARRLGTNHRSVYYVLKTNGIPTRDARESHGGGKACKPVTRTPQGDAPFCRCGCGARTDWSQSKNRWRVYVAGHYRPPRPHHDPGWLRAEYVDKRRSAREIAEGSGVAESTILKCLRKFEIPRRNMSECHIGLQTGEKNPAWKGGVAQWEYAPGWKVIARRIRNRDEWTCQDCGEQRKRWGHHLHVHHIDGNKLNNDEGNLIALCAYCHRQRHREGVI